MGGRPTPSPLFPSGIGDGERREIPNIINKTTNSFFNPSAATRTDTETVQYSRDSKYTEQWKDSGEVNPTIENQEESITVTIPASFTLRGRVNPPPLPLTTVKREQEFECKDK